MKTLFRIIPVFFCLLIISNVSKSDTLSGKTTPSGKVMGSIGSSSKWMSGWLDLEKLSNFKKGGELIIRVSGTANKLLIRLLRKGINPNGSEGIEGGIVPVPKNKVIKINLKRNYENITQISVHGGRNPWGIELGGGNGAAKIMSVDYISP